MRFAELIGTAGPEEIPEYRAEGEIERVYYEIRQSLRVTGVNLVFRKWADYDNFLPVLWDELRPNVETRIFEEAAGQVREEAVGGTQALSQPEPGSLANLGESQRRQIGMALDLYHYINPKLLVLTSAVHQALQGVHIGSGAVSDAGRSERGEPAKMYSMEMEEEKPEERIIRQLFKDIKKTLSLPSINSDYRTLALWPDYLKSAWNRIKPLYKTAEFQAAEDRLRGRARELARTFPHPVSLTMGRLRELGVEAEKVQQTTEQFERLLPTLVLNIALLRSDWRKWEESQSPGLSTSTITSVPQEEKPRGPQTSPSVDEPQGNSTWRAFQKRQHLVEWGDHFVSYIDEGHSDPVVLLHGLPTWGFLWEKTIEGLKNRHRVLAPDLLGFGYSEKRDSFDRSLARQTEMLDALFTSLELQSAHIIGHDIGGGIALRLATLFPHRVRSLCLMNTVCYDSWPVEQMLQLGHPAARQRLSAAKTLKSLKQALQPGFQTSPDPGFLDGLLSPWRTETGKLSLVRNAVALDTNQTVEITRLMPQISVPTLVVWGEDDPFQLVKYGERLAKDIPGATLVRIAAARHFVMLDQPERVQRAVDEFLNRQGVQENRAAA